MPNLTLVSNEPQGPLQPPSSPTPVEMLNQVHNRLFTILNRLACAAEVLRRSDVLEQHELELRASIVTEACTRELIELHGQLDLAIVEVVHG